MLKHDGNGSYLCFYLFGHSWWPPLGSWAVLWLIWLIRRLAFESCPLNIIPVSLERKCYCRTRQMIYYLPTEMFMKLWCSFCNGQRWLDKMRLPRNGMMNTHKHRQNADVNNSYIYRRWILKCLRNNSLTKHLQWWVASPKTNRNTHTSMHMTWSWAEASISKSLLNIQGNIRRKLKAVQQFCCKIA
jgi:hypothetical protein